MKNQNQLSGGGCVRFFSSSSQRLSMEKNTNIDKKNCIEFENK